MENLIAQQENNSDLIAKFVANTQKAGKQALTAGYLQGRQLLLEKYWNKVEDIHAAIVKQPDDPLAARYFKDDLHAFIELNYATALGWLIDSLHALQNPGGNVPEAQANQVANANQANNNAQIKLPAISIPKFCGDFSTWTSFYDLFDALVVKNAALSNVNKLHHLKASLSGEAELVLRHFAIEENNFQPAWALLQRRFANKRMLVNAQFAKLFSQPKMQASNANTIRRILDASTEAIASLQSQLEGAQQFETLIIYVLTQQLDVKTVEAWEHSLNNADDIPTLQAFFDFLENHSRMQDLVQYSCKNTPSMRVQSKAESHRNIKTLNASKSSMHCALCDKPNHFIYKCKKFRALSVAERRNIVNTKGWCNRCLSPQHKTPECPQNWLCLKCNGPHNNLLHQPTDNPTASTPTTSNQQPTPANSNKVPVAETHSQQRESSIFAHHAAEFQSSRTLLATAQLIITSSAGQDFKFRALIDPGSEACFISRTAVNLLRLPFQKINTHIKGMGGVTIGNYKHLLSCAIKSIHNPEATFEIDAVIMPQLTESHPPEFLQQISPWVHLQNLPLADPAYYNNDTIDVVLGADTFQDLFLPDIRKGPRGSPAAQQTVLGYILIGKLNRPHNAPHASREIKVCFNQVAICEQLQKFWEMEEVPDIKKPSKEEEDCEYHYQTTHIRMPNGRYGVELPFNLPNNTSPEFGNSRQQALSRLFQVERRLQSNADLKAQYEEFIDEYRRLGHMQLATKTNVGASFYLPHHAIIRPSSISTKLRVVFDASAKDSRGKSLNDTLLIGPTIQEDLLSILLRWRKHRIAITADAEKMYRQIEVHPKHRPFQRILWRDEQNKIIEYELSTVTYGTACAPYLAIRTIHQLAHDEQQQFPNACQRTLKDMYVDDFISGGDSLEETQQLQRDMAQLFKSGGFNLRKWSSNSKQILDDIPATNREAVTCLDICRDDVVKTLGVMWHTTVDEFHFVVKMSEEPSTFTKRSLLSDVSKLFDPIGFLAPVLISAKILLQSLWLKGLDWDDQLPEDVVKEWHSLRSNLREIATIKIPRWIGTSKSTKIELHGFCDASTKAYAAVIYCRTEKNGSYSVQILTSKTRVAPIKQISLPNLELCGATLLAKLMKKVQTTMDMEVTLFAWTDSTIVLDWIRSNTHKKTFVANRITTILENLKPTHWRHVRSKDNPADVASRGICPSQLQQHALWWHGPTWLQRPAEEWPSQLQKPETDNIPTEILIAATTKTLDEMDNLPAILARHSNLDKLVRVIAYCIRFMRNCRTKSPTTGRLEAVDQRESLQKIVRYVQSTTYGDEIKSIQHGKSLTSSKILTLSPFICGDGLLRVGGRLQNAKMGFNNMHPILLPHDHHITKLIITKTHRETLHGGLKITLATLRQQYWVPNARTTIRQIIHRCVTCHRYAAHRREQLMSPLPSTRVMESRAFTHTGVDYAGPFNLRLSTHRGRGTYKGFVAVFVCMATKAVHLEVASDMSTKSFIAAFKRFTSRRGQCSNLYSDNGTNFVGANRELKTNFDDAMAELSSAAAELLANQDTTWHFIPANSPHFGGLWEAAVKSFKYHLKRIINQTIMTYEEFATLLTSIEAILNSRPLCQLSSDPNDVEALTPGHFLIGGPLNAVPEPSLLDIENNRLTRWQLHVKMHQDFWRAWSKEYLNELQRRPKKCTTPRENLQVDDIVLIKDDRLPPANWMLARIIRVHPGKDGIVRAITVKHKTGETTRATNRVCRLPIESQ